MPTLGQYLQQKQREGVDPATIVAKVGLRPDQLTPALLAVDVGVLGAITTNPLYGGAVALQQPQQETLPPQTPVGLPSSGEPEQTGEVRLNDVPAGERAANAFALMNPVTAMLPTAAGAAYGAAKEVGRGFAGLVGQEQNYRKALSMLPPLLREDLDEMPATQRDRVAYQDVLDKREQRNYLDTSDESAADIARGIIGPVAEVTGISSTGYEHLPLWKQVLPTMATRFARGRQFGEGAAIGPGVMVAQVIDEPSKTIRNDWPNLTFQIASLLLAARSLAAKPAPKGSLPAGFSSPPVEGVARAPIGELPAAALQREGTAIQKTGGATRASTKAVAAAQEAVAQGQGRVVATRPIVASALSGIDRAAGAATRGLFAAGMTAATGAPPGFAAAMGAAAATVPMLLEIAGNRFPKLGDAMTLGKQRFIEGGYAPTPQGRDFIREAVVDPQRARSSVEVETAGSMARGAGQPLLPNAEARAGSPVYDLHHMQLYGDTFVERPTSGLRYGEGAAKAADANIEARSLAEQSKMATAARQRMAQSERNVAGQIERIGDVDPAAIGRELEVVQREIDDTRAIASEMRKIERKKDRMPWMRYRAEQKRDAAVERDVGKAWDDKKVREYAKHRHVLNDLEPNLRKSEILGKESREKAEAMLAADPTVADKGQRGKRLRPEQREYRRLVRVADVEDARAKRIRAAIEKTEKAYQSKLRYYDERKFDAVEQEAYRATEAEKRHAESLNRIEEKLRVMEQELAAQLNRLPPELQESMDFKGWLDDRYKERNRLRKAIRLDELRDRLAVLEQQRLDFEAMRAKFAERQREIKTQQRSGEIPTTSKDLTKFAGAVEERKRTFVKDGQPLYYIDEATKKQRPVTRFLPVEDPILNESITRLHDKANANRAPNTPEIPASYFERLLVDLTLDDSPLLAGSKAIRGWVAKHISKELGFDKTRKLSRSQRKRRRVIEEAIQKELEATAESALRAGGSGSKPRWSSVEIDGKTFNLRDLSTQAAIEFNKRKLPWWQGEGTVRDVAVRQAARRAGKALALKVEEAMFVRKIHSEAARGVPEDAGNPYDRAAYAFADTIVNKSRERNAVDFDPVAVGKQILADPMAFINHVVKTTGLKLDSMEPAFLAHQFAKDLMDNYVVGSDSLRQLMERGASEGHIKDNRQIWMHKHVSEPVNVHAQGIRLLSDTQAVEAWLHRVGQHVKGMRTYADFAVHMGNNLSNVLMRQLMDPLLPVDRLWSDASIVKRWDQWAKKGVAEGQSIKVGSTFVSPDNVMRSLADTGIVDTSMIADLARHVGQGDSSLGMWSSFMRSLKEGARKAYIAGDSIPKLAETERGMAFLFKRLDQLGDGRTITLDLGSKVAVQLEKRGGAIVDTATGKALDGAALADVAAKAAFETPKGYLFDFNNLPTALAVAGRLPIMNVMQPFLSWMWKATDIPGVKPGMGSALLKYDPTFILETTDPKIRMGRIADLAKLSAKRAMVAGAARATYDFGDIQGMADASGNKSIPPAFLVYSTERDDEDSKLPFYSAFAFGPSLNAMRAGSAVIGAMFGNKWAERLDPEYDQAKLTENERRRMAGARKWWADWNSGKAGSINDLLAFGGLAGSISGDVLDYADRKEKAGEPMEWTEPMMMMLLAAASGSAVDVARVLSSLKSGDSEFSMWRDVMVNNKVRGAPSRAPGKEDWIRYASRMLFGIAVETKPTIILNADEMARYTSTVSRNVISKQVKKAVAGMFADASRVQQGVSGLARAQKVVQGALADFDKSKKSPIEALEELRAKVNKSMGTDGDSRFNQIIDQVKVEARIMAAVFAEEGRRIEVALKKAPQRRDGKPIARSNTRAYLRERYERRRKRVKEATGE